MQERLKQQMLDGERTPFGLIWLLPPGKALLWFASTLFLACLLTLMPPRLAADPVTPFEYVLALYAVTSAPLILGANPPTILFSIVS